MTSPTRTASPAGAMARGTTAYGCVFIAGMVVVALAGTVVLTVAIVASFSAFAYLGLPADPNTLTLAFTGLGLAGAALGFFIAKAIEFNNGREDRLSAQKRAAYAALMAPWLGASVREGAAETDDPAPGDRAESQSPDFLGALMFGSDAVVRAYGDFRSAAANPSAPPPEVVAHLVLVDRFRNNISTQPL